MEDYEEKYLKYKNKYLQLKNKMNVNQYAGLIGKIDTTQLDLIKSNDEIPEMIKKYVKMITIPDTEVIRVGSSMIKIQPYFSDVDVMNIIHKKINSEELVKFFIGELKKLISIIAQEKDMFFSDFKVGGLHWTLEQIQQEKNGELSLYDACFVKDVIKLDIITPYDGRYLEMSTFFILKSINEYINVESNYFDTFKKSLLKDISHYQDSKPFKAIKRVWSLARILKDSKTLDLLHKLIKSNIALLAQVNADIETLVLLVEHKSKYDVEFVLNELDGFRERLSTILDIKLDFEKINLIIDNIKLLFRFQNLTEAEINICGSLNKLHNYLMEYINKETLDYLASIQYKFPIEKSSEPIDTQSDMETIHSDIPEIV